MVPISSFFPRLLPSVVGCPEPLAEQALLDAAIEFCERSHAMVIDLDPVPVSAGTSEYELELPSQTRLGIVWSMWLDGRLLTPVPLVQASRSTTPGYPTAYAATYVDEAVVVRLMPGPDLATTGDLVGRVSVVPTRSATTVLSALYNEFCDAVVDGAAARLKQTPGQVFTDIQMGLNLDMKFRRQCSDARARGHHGRAMNSLSVTPRSL